MLTIYTGERKAFSWGRGDYGQLGRDIKKSEGANQVIVCCPIPVEVPTLENVRQVNKLILGHDHFSCMLVIGLITMHNLIRQQFCFNSCTCMWQGPNVL